MLDTMFILFHDIQTAYWQIDSSSIESITCWPATVTSRVLEYVINAKLIVARYP